MPYIITEPCIDLKDKSCIEECPVDCIYEGARMLYIHPDECVDCGACEPVCPVEAIFYEDDVPEQWHHFIQANVQFFEALGSPGSARKVGPLAVDAPLIVGSTSLPEPEYVGIVKEFAGLTSCQPGTIALLSSADHLTSGLIDILPLFYDRILILHSTSAASLADRAEALREAGVLDVSNIDGWIVQISDQLLRLWQYLSALAPDLKNELASYKQGDQMTRVFPWLNTKAAETGVEIEGTRWTESIRYAMEILLPQLLQALTQQSELRIESVTAASRYASAPRTTATRTAPNDAMTWNFDPIMPDTSGVPVKELLEFRAEFGHHFRRHLDLIRRATQEVNPTLNTVDWEFWATRRDDIAESAYMLRALTRPLVPKSNRTWGLGAIGDVAQANQSSSASIFRQALGAAIGPVDLNIPATFSFVFSPPDWPTI